MHHNKKKIGEKVNGWKTYDLILMVMKLGNGYIEIPTLYFGVLEIFHTKNIHILYRCCINVNVEITISNSLSMIMRKTFTLPIAASYSKLFRLRQSSILRDFV